MMRVVIAILNYNGAPLLRRFLPSVIAHSKSNQNFTAEIAVIDNASTDDSRALLAAEFPEVKLVSLKQNFGYSGGYNHGLAELDGDIFVLLNSDVEPTPGWLEAPVRMFSDYPEVAAVQPKIRNATDRRLFDYAGAAGGFLDALGYPYCRGRMLQTIEEDCGQYDNDCDITWASGACLFVRTPDWWKSGGMAEEFFAHMEEIEWCWRIRRMNRSVRYCAGSTVFHLGGGTLPAGNPRKVFLNFRNSLSLLFRHLPGRLLVFRLPMRLLLDVAASLVFLLSGKWSSALAVWKAMFSFSQSIRYERIKRNQFSNLKYPEGLPGKGSLLWDYYVRRKKIWSKV